MRRKAIAEQRPQFLSLVSVVVVAVVVAVVASVHC